MSFMHKFNLSKSAQSQRCKNCIGAIQSRYWTFRETLDTIESQQRAEVKNMKILKPIQKIPGGLMLIPMAVAAVVNTFFPQVMQIGNPFSAVFSNKGTMCVVGILLVFAGIQTRPVQLVQSLRRSGILVGLKLILNILLCTAALAMFGQEGLAGISILAFAAALTSCNPGVYIALMESLGDDRAACVSGGTSSAACQCKSSGSCTRHRSGK